MSSAATQSNRWYDFLGWLELNKKPVAIASVALIVLIALVVAYQWHRRNRQTEASFAVTALRSAGGATALASRPDEYLGLADRYAGTAAGERALLLGADRLFTERRYPEARAQFEKFLEKYKNSTWSGQAHFGIAASLEAENRADDAAAKYQQIISGFGSDPIADQARIAIARLREARNQPADALKLYDEVMNSKMPGMWTLVARQYRERLLQQHPALAPTNAPAPPAGTNLPLTLKLPTHAPAPGARTNTGAAPAPATP